MIVLGFYADQGEPQAFGKSKQFSAKAGKLAYLTAFNKGSACWVELYDTADGSDLTGLVPRVLPLAANALVGWSQLLFKKGIFARAVDAASGGSLIAGNDVKFDAGFMEETYSG